MRDSLYRALELEGYRVLAVSNGEAALLSLKEQRPSVLILDVYDADSRWPFGVSAFAVSG